MTFETTLKKIILLTTCAIFTTGSIHAAGAGSGAGAAAGGGGGYAGGGRADGGAAGGGAGGNPPPASGGDDDIGDLDAELEALFAAHGREKRASEQRRAEAQGEHQAYLDARRDHRDKRAADRARLDAIKDALTANEGRIASLREGEGVAGGTTLASHFDGKIDASKARIDDSRGEFTRLAGELFGLENDLVTYIEHLKSTDKISNKVAGVLQRHLDGIQSAIYGVRERGVTTENLERLTTSLDELVQTLKEDSRDVVALSAQLRTRVAALGELASAKDLSRDDPGFPIFPAAPTHDPSGGDSAGGSDDDDDDDDDDDEAASGRD